MGHNLRQNQAELSLLTRHVNTLQETCLVLLFFIQGLFLGFKNLHNKMSACAFKKQQDI